MALQAFYGDLGEVDGNIRFADEIQAWLQSLGDKLVAKGPAESAFARAKPAASSSRAAGTVALYLVSSANPDFGATLVVSHRDMANPLIKGRADGVHVHAQARLLRDGRWVSENFKTNAIPLVSLEDVAIIDVLSSILQRHTPEFSWADEAAKL